MKFLNKYGSKIIVTLVTIILLILIGITADRDNITKVESKFGDFLTPIQKFFYNTGESISNTFSSLTTFSQIKHENSLMKDKIVQLEEENRRMQDIISRSDFLRNEAILKENIDFIFVDAQVVGKDPGNWFNKFVIDKGSKDDIKKGDPVILGVAFEDGIIEAGLVGRVIEVGDKWSKVLSIIDNGSNVSFKAIRTQDNGIVTGDLNEEITGFLFDLNADIMKEDKLVTSGLGEIFIPGLYIGEISEVIKENDDLIKKIKVEPAVDFKNINEVFVITGSK